jgi:hypothetical protein
VSAIPGFGFKGLTDQRGDFFIRNRSGATWPQFVMQAGQSLLQIALTPVANHLMANADSFGNGIVRDTIGCEQNYLRSSNQTVR